MCPIHRIFPFLLLSSAALAQDGEQPVVGSDTASGDDFGGAVAIDGDTMVVGAHQHDANGFGAGAAYVFTHVGGMWVEQQKLIDPSVDTGDKFGISVAIDGDRIAVGASLDEDADGDIPGAVYVFELIGSSWVRTARLEDASLNTGSEYGFAVALSGNRLATSAHESSGGGTVYVYELDMGSWSLEYSLQSPDAGATDDFGFSLALSDDWILVGAPYNDGLAGNAGAAYFFDAQGQFTQKLVSSGPSPAGGELGYSVALEGDLAVIGAGAENTAAGSDAGAAYVFREASGVWSEEARIEAPPTETSVTSDLFGRDVAISENRILVGAERASGDKGRAYLYLPSAGSWRIASVFSAADAATTDRAGEAIALDGEFAALGIDGADDAGSNSGRVSSFDLDAGLLGGIVPIDLFSGGTQYLTVDAGSGAAGQFYALLGSLSGSSPGFPFKGVTIPLNPDDYFLLTLTAPNTPPLAGSFGVLDSNGRGFGQVDLPPGTDPSLVGMTVNHAAMTFQLGPFQVTSASRPLPTDFE